MNKAIFWFRQDLRTYDNRWFIRCILENEEILPIFILDKNLVENFWWLEDKKFGFLREMLENLSKEIEKLSWKKLNIFYEYPENLIPYLFEKYGIEKIYANKTYGNYWKKRDEKIKNLVNIEFVLEKDFLILQPEEIVQMKVFTPYSKRWKDKEKDLRELSPKNFKKLEIEENFEAKDFIKIEKHPYFTLDFWEKRLEIIKNFIDFSNFLNRWELVWIPRLNEIHQAPVFESMKKIEKNHDYENSRNNLDIDWTSKISPYLRFWVFSIRQIYNSWVKNATFINELIWREFWQHIDYYFPECKKQEFQENKRNIKWEKNDFLFERWCEGKTWYPIVDACMKQLIETNRMHGRWRMIVASFLTKDLHIDWRLWEAFFKKHLLDYDENMNFWNWQWSASVWADPKPLRIFSPILQSEKFDSEAKFMKKYLPELSWQDLKAIHNPLENNLEYLKPIVDHRIEQKAAREMYKNII